MINIIQLLRQRRFTPIINRNKPKIVNVYQLQYKNYKAPIGFGDFIKGSLYLLALCDKHGFDFEIDIRHPISKYFKPHTEFNEVSINIDKENLWNNMWNYKDGHINTLRRVGCYYTCARQAKMPNVTQSQIDAVKSYFVPNEELADNVDKITAKYALTKGNYSVIHIRTGDHYLFNSKLVGALVLIEKKILQNVDMTKQYIVLSDNNNLKRYLQKHSNFHTDCDSTIVHMGGAKEEDNYLDSLTDFLLMANADAICSFSVYAWGSGFSECASKLYNVPLKKFKI